MTRNVRSAATVLLALGIAASAHRGAVGEGAAKAGPVPTFQVDAEWPKLPNNWVMGDPSSVAVDRHDNVWVLHRPRTVPAERKDRAAPPVLEFDKHGKFLQAWGGGSEQFQWPDTDNGAAVDYRHNA